MYIQDFPFLKALVATVFYDNDFKKVTQNSLFVDNKIISIKLPNNKVLFALIDKDLAFFEYSFNEKRFECLPVFLTYSRKKTLGENLLKAIKKAQSKGFYKDITIDLSSANSNLFIEKNIQHNIDKNLAKELDIKKIFFTECFKVAEKGYSIKDYRSVCDFEALLERYKDKEEMVALIKDNKLLLTKFLDNYISLLEKKVYAKNAIQPYLKLYRQPILIKAFYNNLKQEGHLPSNLTILSGRDDTDIVDIVSNELIEKDELIYTLIKFLLTIKFNFSNKCKSLLKDSSREILSSIKVTESRWDEIHLENPWLLSYFFQTPTVSPNITRCDTIKWDESVVVEFANDVSFRLNLDTEGKKQSLKYCFDINDPRDDMFKIAFAKRSTQNSFEKYIANIVNNENGSERIYSDKLFEKLNELAEVINNENYCDTKEIKNMSSASNRSNQIDQRKFDEFDNCIEETYHCLENLYRFNANKLSNHFSEFLSKEQEIVVI